MIQDNFKEYSNFIYAIGFFGEYITFFITFFLLFNQHIYLFFFVVFFVLNRTLNRYLKNYFKQLRPKNPNKFLESEKFANKNHQVYGLPSGHTQESVFALIYYYLIINQFNYWVLLLLIIVIFIIYERYTFKNHTLYQLIMGCVFGIIVGYVSYYLVTKIKKMY